MNNSCVNCTHKKICGQKDNYYFSKNAINQAIKEHPIIKVQMKCTYFKKETLLRKFITHFFK